MTRIDEICPLVNSKQYWDHRFDSDWEAKEGRHQSRFFARLAIKHAPSWFNRLICRNSYSICDWGCAEGDGTDQLAQAWQGQVTGIDFSENAISKAQYYYPNCRFKAENWTEIESSEKFDVIFSSNTLEHFSEPWQVARKLVARADKFIVLLVPFNEIKRITEHEYTFTSANIPVKLDDEWILLYSKSIDAAKEDTSYWPGQQILLVYSRQSMLSALELTMADLLIDDGENERIRTQLEMRHIEYLNDKENYIAALREELDLSLRGQHSLREELDLSRKGQHSLREELDLSLKGQHSLREELDLSRKGQHSLREQLNQSGLEHRSLRDLLELANSDNRRLVKEVDLAHGQLSAVEAKLRKIKQSSSWRMTAPIREVAKGLRTTGRTARQLVRRTKTANIPSSIAVNSTDANSSISRNDNETPTQFYPGSPLLRGEVVIICGIPFDDVGGGQRAAQLARCALRTGKKVIFLHIYKKYDFISRTYVESTVGSPLLIHKSIKSLNPAFLLSLVSASATIVIEHPHPAVIPFLRAAKARGIKVIFELIDDWETSLGGDWFGIDTYKEIVAKSDVVVGTAKILVERLRSLGRHDALYVPNAANEYIFDKYKQNSAPNDLPEKGDTFLYFGSLYGEWFAWSYLESAALALPDCNFVLIGDSPAKADLPTNIKFLGPKLIDELPAYLQHSTAAILPFLPGQISAAVSPIKIFEYLFSGKPVISSFLPEIEGYPGVMIARSAEEFAELCRNVTLDEVETYNNDLFISNNSWFSRLDDLVGGKSIARVFE